MKFNVIEKEEIINLPTNEKKVIQIATLNIISLVNAITTKAEIVMNPIEKNLGYEVFLAGSISTDDENFFIQRLTSQMDTFLKMAEIPYELIVEK